MFEPLLCERRLGFDRGRGGISRAKVNRKGQPLGKTFYLPKNGAAGTPGRLPL
jgi:hypothetical protein